MENMKPEVNDMFAVRIGQASETMDLIGYFVVLQRDTDHDMYLIQLREVRQEPRKDKEDGIPF